LFEGIIGGGAVLMIGMFIKSLFVWVEDVQQMDADERYKEYMGL
jgi:hypothetical protein